VKRGIVFGVLLAVAVTGTGVAASRYVITSKRQIKPAVLQQLRGDAGPRGPKGPTGPAGQPGATGAPGVSSVQYITSAAVPYCALSTPTCSVATATATCPAGSYAVGGSAAPSTIETTVSTFISATEYSAVSANDSQFTGQLTTTVACASGSGLSAFASRLSRSSAQSAETQAQVAASRWRSER